jgi:UDP-N-acetylglucosamine 2-epimerase (hydrolysing)
MKKIWFLTGTRADFGKLKSLISSVSSEPDIETKILITGMHLMTSFGLTRNEVEDSFPTVTKIEFVNQVEGDPMDLAIANTILGLSNIFKTDKPDLLVVHGDRLEALAAGVSAVSNGILVGHIEGGELSGTIDESFRHAVSKLSHIHFVSNEDSRRRLLQMGESEESVFVIGSPDLDFMESSLNLDLDLVKTHYEIDFDTYGLAIFHPVVTDPKENEMLSNSLDRKSVV